MPYAYTSMCVVVVGTVLIFRTIPIKRHPLFFFFFFTGKILFLRFFHLCLINRTRRIHRSTLPFAEIHVSTSIYYPWAKKFSIGRKCTKLFKISEILPNFFVYFKQRYFTREISVVFKYLFESAFVRRLFATKRMEPR